MGNVEIACFSFSIFPWPWSADCLQRHEADDTLKTKVVYPTTNPLCLPGLSLGLWSQKKSVQSPVVSVTCHFPVKIGPKIYRRIMTLLKSAPKTWHAGRFPYWAKGMPQAFLHLPFHLLLVPSHLVAYAERT